jgi:hypothetical protein
MMSGQLVTVRSPVAMLPLMTAKWVVANGVQLAALAEVEDLVPGGLVHFTFEIGQEVVAVEVDLPGLAVGLESIFHFFDDIRHARGRQERGQPVLMGDDLAANSARLDHARPADEI